MKLQLSLSFIKDLIDFNILNKNLLLKETQLTNNLFCIFSLNKEFKVFVNIIRYVTIKRYDFIFIIVEDPFLYQILVKKIFHLNFKIKIPIIISTKNQTMSKQYAQKKILIVDLSNSLKHKFEDFSVCFSKKKSLSNMNVGAYNISADINNIKALTFFFILIHYLLKKD